MISEWLVPQFKEAGILNIVIFQLYEAPAHFVLEVRRYMNVTFPQQWIWWVSGSFTLATMESRPYNIQ